MIGYILVGLSVVLLVLFLFVVFSHHKSNIREEVEDLRREAVENENRNAEMRKELEIQ